MTAKKIEATQNTGDRQIVITRLIDAPRDLVWEAMTDPKQVVLWWGPTGFTSTIHEMDVRPGGVWKHAMRGPDGVEYANKSIYIEIVKPERIAYSHGGGRKGEEGVSFQASWTLEAVGKKTRLTLRSVFPSAEARDLIVRQFHAIEGGNQALDRLSVHLAKIEPFVIARTLGASREVLWKAWTEPERMAHWWGPKGCKSHVVKMDFRAGGTNHYYMEFPDGNKMWGLQVYREIVKPEKLVFVNSFSDEKGNLTRHPMSPSWPIEMLTTIKFTEAQGKTTVNIQWLPIDPTDEERATFEGGRASMNQGWGGSLDQLGVYLAEHGKI